VFEVARQAGEVVAGRTETGRLEFLADERHACAGQGVSVLLTRRPAGAGILHRSQGQAGSLDQLSFRKQFQCRSNELLPSVVAWVAVLDEHVCLVADQARGDFFEQVRFSS
jgi:hypothetical protein